MYDAFSAPIRKMSDAMNIAISTFQTMQDVGDKAVDISGLEQARSQLGEVSADMIRMGEEMERIREEAAKPPPAPPPPEWITQPLPELFHSTGIDRFQLELGDANQKLQEMIAAQQSMSMLDMSFLPDNAQNEIVQLNQRIAETQQRFQEAVREKEQLGERAPPEALDGLNAAIERMRGQIDQALSTQNNLNDAMRSGDLSKVNDAYNRLNAQVNSIDGGIRDNIKQQRAFKQTVEESTGAMGGLLKKVVAIGGAYVGVNAAKGFFNSATAAANETIRAEQRLVSIMSNINGMTKDGVDLVRQRTKELEAQGIAIAASTGVYGQSQLAEYVYDPTNIAAMTESMYNLATETYGVNVSQEQLMQTANLMGKVMMGDINALSRNGFKIDAIFSEAEQKLLKTGTEAQRAALVIQMVEENLSGLSQAMGETPEGQAIRLANAWGSVQEKIGYGVMPLIGQLSSYLMENMPMIESVFLNVFSNIINVMQSTLQVAMSVSNFIVSNWSAIEPVLWGLVGAFTAFLVVSRLYAAQQAIAALATGTSTAAMFYQTMTTQGLAAAWRGLNTAMKANIFILIASLIIGVIVWIVNLWQKNDAFAAAMMRVWNTILNFFDQIPIFFRRVGNGIVNVFQSMKVRSLQIMEDMINGVIDRINTLVNTLNKIKGVSLNTIDKVEFAASAAAEAEAIKQAGEAAVADMVAAAKERAEQRELDVQTRIKEREEQRKQDDEDTNKKFEPPPIYGEDKLGDGQWEVDNTPLGGTIDKVKKVGKIEDKVDISSEDLKVMRDLAEMKTIQNFVTLTPTVQVTTGDINNGTDLDTLLNGIEERMANEIESSAKGLVK
ncbi:hypothetical protein EBB07_33785 [Paenibacillaceae bacterium]|nr:hypothetical protein EBB07_33785 [Paenibacillaceae bacterium]